MAMNIDKRIKYFCYLAGVESRYCRDFDSTLLINRTPRFISEYNIGNKISLRIHRFREIKELQQPRENLTDNQIIYRLKTLAFEEDLDVGTEGYILKPHPHSINLEYYLKFILPHLEFGNATFSFLAQNPQRNPSTALGVPIRRNRFTSY